MARRRVAFRKKRQNRLGMALVSIVVIMLFTVIMIKSTDLKEKKAAYDEKEATLEQQIENENERTQELIEYEKYTKTAKYVEEVAKEKLGLVYEDEIIFESEDGN
ncbi:MAG: septum formation initiator family protein [Lachnospiraceae bacterium]|nr:septum formation initiator family protein [Lachnospiraceae bacterium]